MKLFNNKTISVNMKSDNDKIIFDDRINNSHIFNESLININNLIQKILEENRKNKNKDNNDNLEENKENTDYEKNENNKILDISSNKNNNKYNDFNDYRDKNKINNIYENEKNKNNELFNKEKIKDKKQNENIVKKINMNNAEDPSNKIYKNEINVKKISSNKIKTNKSRQNSKKKRESLSIKNYIKKVKNTYEEDKINKTKNKSLNNLELKYEENEKSGIELINDIKINKKNYTLKNRSNTEKNLKKPNIYSTDTRKKTRNIIINKNNNFINSTIKRKSFHKYKNNNPNNKTNQNKNNNNIIKNNNLNQYNKKNIENITLEKLSPKEKSYYILSNSPILRLKERLLFGRSSINLRNIQSIKDILNKNEIFLKDKIKELNEKISECDKKINLAFNASKTAEINFNFILSKDEEELKNYVLFSDNEADKKEYYIYLKIIYILFDENYENIELNKLYENLYILINKKGFKNIKDYLYHIYFKNKENINIIVKINKISNLLEDTNYLEETNFQMKFCRFVLFTSFLINEIIHYGTNIKNIINLKIKTKELIDVIKEKLDLYDKKVAKKN